MGASLKVNPTLVGSESSIELDVKGEISSEEISLHGTYNGGLSLEVGANTVSLKHVDGSFTYSKTAITADIKASANLFGSDVDIEFKYPEDSGDCATFRVTDKQTFSLGSLLTHVLPSSDNDQDLDAPNQVLKELLQDSIHDITVSFSPNCHTVDASADFTSSVFGSAQLGLGVAKDSSGWHYHVSAIPGSDWSLSTSSLVKGNFPKLSLDTPVFVLSSQAGDVSVKLPDSTSIDLNVETGLNFDTKLKLDDTPIAQFIKGFVSSETTLELKGQFSKTSWSFGADLEGSVSLGGGATLSKAVITVHSLPSKGAAVTLSGELDFVNPFNSQQHITLDVEGDYSSTGSLTLSGSLTGANSAATINIGPASLNLENIQVDVTYKKGENLSGKLKGSIAFGSAHLDGEISLFRGTSGSGVSLTVSLKEDPALTLGNLIDGVVGSSTLSGLTLPSGLSDGVRNSWAFNNFTATLKSNPASFDGSGSMTLFGSSNLNVIFKAANEGSGTSKKWSFTFGVLLKVQSFSSVVSGASVLDDLPLSNFALAVTSADAVDIPFDGLAVPYHAEHGLNVFASLSLSGTDTLNAISQWTGVKQVTVRAVIARATKFSVHASVQGSLTLFKVWFLLNE